MYLPYKYAILLIHVISLHGETVLNYSSSDEPRRTSTSSLVLRLCVYRLRLFPVWPIVDVEEIMGRLHSEPENMDAYALANAVGAATIAQLKLEGPENGDMQTAALMEAECQRAISLLRKDGQELSINLNALRVSFFLHAYHENRSPGGSRSLLYLREAITIAQIMGLHREVTYSAYTAREQQMRRRILSLLFVTERSGRSALRSEYLYGKLSWLTVLTSMYKIEESRCSINCR